MNRKLIIEMCSDLDYEEMVADISYENRTIATINKEKGVENLEIEIFPLEKEIPSLKLPVDDFIEALVFAKKCLIESKKLSDEE